MWRQDKEQPQQGQSNRCMEQEGRVVSKEERTCETCDHCIYIGEGDFICDRKDEPVLVIEDWIELRLPGRKWVDE